MKSIINSFTGAGRNRNSASESKSDHKGTNSIDTTTINPNNLRGMDEKLFNTCVDLLEVFAKKLSVETASFASDLMAVNHASREVDSVVSSILGGMASKRFLEANPSAILWVSLLKVLESIPALFTAEQCGDLRDASEDGLALLGTARSQLTVHSTQLTPPPPLSSPLSRQSCCCHCCPISSHHHHVSFISLPVRICDTHGLVLSPPLHFTRSDSFSL